MIKSNFPLARIKTLAKEQSVYLAQLNNEEFATRLGADALIQLDSALKNYLNRLYSQARDVAKMSKRNTIYAKDINYVLTNNTVA